MKRIQKEALKIKSKTLHGIDDVQIPENDMKKWNFLIVPTVAPYKKGAFRVQVTFPTDYPFRPPELHFTTKIYHPNVDETGRVCLQIISSENWKPATMFEAVLAALVKMIENPEPDHPLRADLAKEFTSNRKKFNRKASEYTAKYAEKRPGPVPPTPSDTSQTETSAPKTDSTPNDSGTSGSSGSSFWNFFSKNK